MHCFKDNINNRKYLLHFRRLLLPPKSPILPNLGGYLWYSCSCTVPVRTLYGTPVHTTFMVHDMYMNVHVMYM